MWLELNVLDITKLLKISDMGNFFTCVFNLN